MVQPHHYTIMQEAEYRTSVLREEARARQLVALAAPQEPRRKLRLAGPVLRLVAALRRHTRRVLRPTPTDNQPAGALTTLDHENAC